LKDFLKNVILLIYTIILIFHLLVGSSFFFSALNSLFEHGISEVGLEGILTIFPGPFSFMIILLVTVIIIQSKQDLSFENSSSFLFFQVALSELLLLFSFAFHSYLFLAIYGFISVSFIVVNLREIRKKKQELMVNTDSGIL